MSKEEDIQKAYFQLQMIEGQVGELQKEITTLQLKKEDILRLKDNLGEFSKQKKNSPGFMSLGLGLYSQSTVMDPSEVLVNVGDNILLSRKVPDAVEMMDHNLKEIDKAVEYLNKNLEAMAGQQGSLQEELQKLASHK